MRLFFILGREPALSVTEIFSVIERESGDEARAQAEQKAICSPEALITDIPDALSPELLMGQLGGTIKIGRVVGESTTSAGNDALIATLISSIETSAAFKNPGRISFGISVYATDLSAAQRVHGLQRNLKKFGMEIKRGLKEQGKQVRWVTSKAPSLSSVVVETNKLLKEGVELVLLVDKEKIMIGHTSCVQPFRDLERRDFPRPARDARSGMLPPKLARMMVNLAATPREGVMFDPFCGSGTILGEAMLLGYAQLMGSDLDPIAVRNTNRNLDWLVRGGFVPAIEHARNTKLFESDVRALPEKLEPRSIDAIVAETFLGPPLTGRETLADLEKNREALTPLFRESLGVISKLLKKDGRAVIAFPLVRYRNEVLPTPALNDLKSFGLQLVTPLTAKLSETLHTEFGRHGQTLIYGRPDQRVWREIAVLEHSSAPVENQKTHARF